MVDPAADLVKVVGSKLIVEIDTRIRIITEADRSVTTIVLPEEY